LLVFNTSVLNKEGGCLIGWLIIACEIGFWVFVLAGTEENTQSGNVWDGIGILFLG
jgi:hypothetical protein